MLLVVWHGLLISLISNDQNSIPMVIFFDSLVTDLAVLSVFFPL